jgi:hypothetical protein
MEHYAFVKTYRPNTAKGLRNKRSTAYSNRLWENASTVTFSFMQDLSDDLKYRIERVIRQWEPFVSLTFELVAASEGQIRIALDGGENYSAIGTEALEVDVDEATLVLGEDPANPIFDATLLHEFGHALGFHHAHLHPDANIPWDREAAYKYYREEHKWTDEDIELNLFSFEKDNTVFLGEYDPLSIMHYPVPNFMTRGNFEMGDNIKISERDKQLARSCYPAIDYRAQII